MNRCRDCKEPVLFVASMSGTSYPLDANPSFRGQFFLAACDGPNGTRLAIPKAWLGDKLDRAQEQGLRLYSNHVLTCPVRKANRERNRLKEAA